MITLLVKDLNRMKRFFLELGWKPSERSSAELVLFPLPGIVLGLFPLSGMTKETGLPESELEKGAGILSYNCRSLEELNHLFETIPKLGCRLVKKPHKTYWGGHAGFFKDPEGNLWEASFNPKMKFNSDGSLSLEK